MDDRRRELLSKQVSIIDANKYIVDNDLAAVVVVVVVVIDAVVVTVQSDEHHKHHLSTPGSAAPQPLAIGR